MLPRHVVLSYSRRNMNLADRLRNDLMKAGVPVWKDDRNIEPGTPNYDKAIREALKGAYAVLLLASPHAVASEFVPDEISLAKSYERRVIPIWIEGKDYIDCVPLGMGKSQYIDARGEHYAHGLAELLDQTKQLISEQTPKLQTVQAIYRNNIVPPGHLIVIFPYPPFSPTATIYPDYGAYGIPDIQDDDAVVVNPDAYQSLKALLDDLYIHYLRERFGPLTYGKDWVLQRHLTAYPQLVVPLSWFFAEGCQPVSSTEPTWAERVSLHECGLEAGTGWEIMELEESDQRGSVAKSKTICLLCRNENIIKSIVSDDLGKNIYYFTHEKHLISVDFDLARPQEFSNYAIINTPYLIESMDTRVLMEPE